MRTKRLLGSVAVVMTVAFVLSGCSLLPTVAGLSVSAAPRAPVVGQCWSATDAEAGAWADWKGSPKVSCSAAHVLYTYAIGTISGVSANSWASGPADRLSTTVQAKAENACSLTSVLPKLRWNQELVQGFFFVPSKADWKAGARWVRCDVGVLAFGTTLADEQLARLPAKISTLASAVASEPERYAFCLDSPVPVSEAGPLGNQDATIADCRDNPQWALAGRGNLPQSVGSPFPSNAVANADSATICSRYAVNSNELWIAYLPDPAKDDTVSSDREVTCWVGQKSDDGSGSAGNV